MSFSFSKSEIKYKRSVGELFPILYNLNPVSFVENKTLLLSEAPVSECLNTIKAVQSSEVVFPKILNLLNNKLVKRII